MDVTLRDRWLEDAHRRMRRAGLRTGAARSAVLELMAADGQCLLSATEVIGRLAGRGSAASVYRALDELTGLGLLRRETSQHGLARYEISDPAGHHHHLVLETTDEIVPFSDLELERAIGRAADRLGVRLTGHDLVLRGVPAG